MTAPASAPSTPQHKQFLQNIAYAQELINAGPYLNPTIAEDLYRAAWSQAVSALDHWVHLEVYERVAAIVMDTTPDRPTQLDKFPMPWKYVERIRHDQERLEDVVREALEAQLGQRTFQNQDDIGSAFQLVLKVGPGTMWGHVATNLGMTKDQVKLKHQEVLFRRNKIVHESDVINATTGERRPISQQEAESAVNWIRQLAAALALALCY